MLYAGVALTNASSNNDHWRLLPLRYLISPNALQEQHDWPIGGITNKPAAPKVSDRAISDDALRQRIESNQFAKLRARGSDLASLNGRSTAESLFRTPRSGGGWWNLSD